MEEKNIDKQNIKDIAKGLDKIANEIDLMTMGVAIAYACRLDNVGVKMRKIVDILEENKVGVKKAKTILMKLEKE